MLNEATIEKMNAMKLSAMAEAFRQQTSSTQYQELSFEERVGMLIDTEWTNRQQRKLSRRLKAAKLRYPASVENIDFQTPRGLNRQLILSLTTCVWITEHQNLIVTGPTGTGKSFLACALAEKACRCDFTASYLRMPRLLHDLAVSRGDGSYGRLLAKLAKTDLLAIDDWLIAPLKDSERRDLLEIIEDRYGHGSTLIATQLPVTSWHEAIGEPTLADAICDRLVHRAHRIELKGISMRERQEKTKTPSAKPESKAKAKG
jgi:DNA replication protein DnaC